jgi:hypothetical protein
VARKPKRRKPLPPWRYGLLGLDPRYGSSANAAAERLTPDRVKLGKRVLKLEAADPGLMSDAREIFQRVRWRFGYQAASDLFEWTAHVCRPEPAKESAKPSKRPPPPPRQGGAHNEAQDNQILMMFRERESLARRPITEAEFAASLVDTPEKCARWGVKDIAKPSPQEQLLRRVKYLRGKHRTK